MSGRGLAGLLSMLLVATLLVGGAHPAAGGLFLAPWDKLAHLAYFLTLSLLLLQLLPGRPWLCLGIALLVGSADELLQLTRPGRQPSLTDWYADAAGCALGLLLHRLIAAWRGLGPAA